MTDLELMRQALDALEQHDAPQRWPFAVKQNSRAVIAALRARLAEPVKAAQPVARWYVLSPDGMACLCADQADTVAQAADADKLFPRHAPHQAVQMAPIAAPGAAPTVQPVAVPDGKLPSIIEAVEFRREAYALDQRQWAYVLGMQPSHYSEFLSGTRSLPKSAMAVSYAFGVPADCLFQCRSTLGASDIDRRLSEIAAAPKGGA